jgi:hypothetical protein
MTVDQFVAIVPGIQNPEFRIQNRRIGVNCHTSDFWILDSGF